MHMVLTHMPIQNLFIQAYYHNVYGESVTVIKLRTFKIKTCMHRKVQMELKIAV